MGLFLNAQNSASTTPELNGRNGTETENEIETETTTPNTKTVVSTTRLVR